MRCGRVCFSFSFLPSFRPSRSFQGHQGCDSALVLVHVHTSPRHSTPLPLSPPRQTLLNSILLHIPSLIYSCTCNSRQAAKAATAATAYLSLFVRPVSVFVFVSVSVSVSPDQREAVHVRRRTYVARDGPSRLATRTPNANPSSALAAPLGVRRRSKAMDGMGGGSNNIIIRSPFMMICLSHFVMTMIAFTLRAPGQRSNHKS